MKKKKLFLIFVTGHEYCDCDSGSDVVLTCPPDELFCDNIGEYCGIYRVFHNVGPKVTAYCS